MSLRHLSGRKPPPAAERFLKSFEIDLESGCWMWQGRSRGSNGYGAIKAHGETIPAHRFSYSLNVGRIPDGLFVLHKCDRPKCVNPDHLFLGTHQDNSDDKVSKNRQAKGAGLAKAQHENRPKGEANGMSKLTENDVRAIRACKMSQRKAAKLFGVSQTTIHYILTGKTWSWI